MNFQEIANFIELVQKPEKFAAALDNIKQEQLRLQAVIETVGKVSEINVLKDKAAKAAAQIEKKLADADIKAEELISNAKKSYDNRVLELKIQLDSSNAKMLEAQALYAKAVEMTNAHNNKRKELAALETRLYTLQDELNVKQQEIEERLNKLRAAMV